MARFSDRWLRPATPCALEIAWQSLTTSKSRVVREAVEARRAARTRAAHALLRVAARFEHDLDAAVLLVAKCFVEVRARLERCSMRDHE